MASCPSLPHPLRCYPQSVSPYSPPPCPASLPFPCLSPPSLLYLSPPSLPLSPFPALPLTPFPRYISSPSLCFLSPSSQPTSQPLPMLSLSPFPTLPLSLFPAWYRIQYRKLLGGNTTPAEIEGQGRVDENMPTTSHYFNHYTELEPLSSLS
ncbi:hypothetical protein Pcinc_011657 [Petrolisthes cinctipes]|uniref:Uncharacterized protein n=1 Tax=Petrolisthes cinctipes TaxID=88211 RepID=A0AAE1KT87_PETCI|nr:hypothetical protein Pcinc_011657 [Petrolisthes cinctipes]